MDVIALIFSLWAFGTWLGGNLDWFESHGWRVLIPLNLGIVWFLGFIPFVVRIYDLRPEWVPGGRKHLSLGESACAALVWMAGMVVFNTWFEHESGRTKKQKFK
jgi:hypothetical protein